MVEENPEIDLNPYINKLRELGLFIQDVENQKSYPNSFWDRLGYTADEMKNMGFLDYVHPDDQEKVRKSLNNVADRSAESNRILFRIRNIAGKWLWVLSSSIGVKRAEDGEILNYIGFDHDVTAEVETRMKAEKALAESESLMRATEIISMNLDPESTVDAILEQAVRVFSFTSASVQLLSDGVLKIVGDIGIRDEPSGEAVCFPISPKTPNYHVITDRKPYIVNRNLFEEYPDFFDNSIMGIKSWMGVPLLYQDKLLGMIAFDHAEENQFDTEYIRLAAAFANQVAIALENSRLFKDVKKLAIQDELTGCYSRRHFFECLESESEKARRYRTPLSLLLFDVDEFKLLNDQFGHVTGDQVLKEIARISADVLRKADIFSRYGGEEFVVLMPSTTIDEAFLVAERVRKSIAEQAMVPGQKITVTISVGCTSICPDDYDNLDNLLARADRAMYASKDSGKNKTTLILPSAVHGL